MIEAPQEKPDTSIYFDPSVDDSTLCRATGWHNNCGLNCLTHFIAAKLETEEGLAQLDSRDYPEYAKLLMTYQEYYELPNEEATWEKVKELMQNNPNPKDREGILGPVLRKHLQKILSQKPEDRWKEGSAAFSRYLDTGTISAEDLAILKPNLMKFQELRKEFIKENNRKLTPEEGEDLRIKAEENLNKKRRDKVISDNVNKMTLEERKSAKEAFLQENPHITNPDSVIRIDIWKQHCISKGINMEEIIAAELEKLPSLPAIDISNQMKFLRNNQVKDKINLAAKEYWLGEGCERYAQHMGNLEASEMVSVDQLGLLTNELQIALEVYTPESIEKSKIDPEVAKNQHGAQARHNPDNNVGVFRVYNAGEHWEYEEPSATKAKIEGSKLDIAKVKAHNQYYPASATNFVSKFMLKKPERYDPGWKKGLYYASGIVPVVTIFPVLATLGSYARFGLANVWHGAIRKSGKFSIMGDYVAGKLGIKSFSIKENEIFNEVRKQVAPSLDPKDKFLAQKVIETRNILDKPSEEQLTSEVVLQDDIPPPPPDEIENPGPPKTSSPEASQPIKKQETSYNINNHASYLYLQEFRGLNLEIPYLKAENGYKGTDKAQYNELIKHLEKIKDHYSGPYDPTKNYQSMYTQLHEIAEKIALKKGNAKGSLVKFHDDFFIKLYENNCKIPEHIHINLIERDPHERDRSSLKHIKGRLKDNKIKKRWWDVTHPENALNKYFSGLRGWFYDPLKKTNVPYVISKIDGGPIHLRMGTQIKGSDELQPSFQNYLAAKHRQHSEPDKYHHVYFNLLKRDLGGYERGFEVTKSKALEKLHGEEAGLGIAVITLPADSEVFFEGYDKHKGTSKDATQSYSTEDIRKILLASIKNNTNDFNIPDDIKERLFGDHVLLPNGEKFFPNLEKIVSELFEKSVLSAVNGKRLVTAAERQAIVFDFVKYQLSDYIIKKLEPETINFSCKDAIDRGGIHALWYEFKSRMESGKPMSETEFRMHLDSSALLVKGRPMNDHRNVIWNAMKVSFLENPEKFKGQDWVGEWILENQPKDRGPKIFGKKEHQRKLEKDGMKLKREIAAAQKIQSQAENDSIPQLPPSPPEELRELMHAAISKKPKSESLSRSPAPSKGLAGLSTALGSKLEPDPGPPPPFQEFDVDDLGPIPPPSPPLTAAMQDALEEELGIKDLPPPPPGWGASSPTMTAGFSQFKAQSEKSPEIVKKQSTLEQSTAEQPTAEQPPSAKSQKKTM